MLSWDEPLDLKLSSGRSDGPVNLENKAYPSSLSIPLTVTRRLICTAFPSPPSSPGKSQPEKQRTLNSNCFLSQHHFPWLCNIQAFPLLFVHHNNDKLLPHLASDNQKSYNNHSILPHWVKYCYNRRIPQLCWDSLSVSYY